jgi:hypothetical protein
MPTVITTTRSPSRLRTDVVAKAPDLLCAELELHRVRRIA